MKMLEEIAGDNQPSHILQKLNACVEPLARWWYRPVVVQAGGGTGQVVVQARWWYRPVCLLPWTYQVSAGHWRL